MLSRSAHGRPVTRIVELVSLVAVAAALAATGAWARSLDTPDQTIGTIGTVNLVLAGAIGVRGALVLKGRERARREVARLVRRHEVLAANSADATILVDRHGTVVEASSSYPTVIGDPDAEPVGRNVFARLHPDAHAEAKRALEGVLASVGGRVDAELPIVNENGLERWMSVRVTNLLDDPDVGLVLINLHDITDRKVAEEQVLHQARHDPVTGAANRGLLVDVMSRANGRTGDSGSSSAILLLDLDDFSSVNERLGHDGGDVLLRQVHQRLLATVRAGDTVARLGGDQFAMLVALRASGPDDAVAMATRIIQRMADPFRINGETVVVGATIGVAEAVVGVDPDSLLRDAAVALSHAKSTGSREIVVFDQALRDAAIDRLRLEADLVVALERSQFELHYQPLVGLRDASVVGVEALLRWEHPDVGLIPPDRFIPLAERNGLIVPIGEWVIRQACAAAARWTEQMGRDVEISVNVSARQLNSDTLVPTIRLALAETGLPASSLVVEITETDLVTDPELASRRLTAVRDLGVRVAIDDFGTGYSSLSYLQQLPVDILKIDRSFIAGIVADAAPPALVKGLVELAHTLGLDTVAEGVEHPHQLAFLRSIGCRHGQGYLFARPAPEASVVAIIGGELLGAG